MSVVDMSDLIAAERAAEAVKAALTDLVAAAAHGADAMVEPQRRYEELLTVFTAAADKVSPRRQAPA